MSLNVKFIFNEQQYTMGLALHFSLTWVGDLIGSAFDMAMQVFGPIWTWVSKLLGDVSDFLVNLIDEVCKMIAKWFVSVDTFFVHVLRFVFG